MNKLTVLGRASQETRGTLLSTVKVDGAPIIEANGNRVRAQPFPAVYPQQKTPF